MTIEHQLILHEGCSLKPYRCPSGKLTIGVGRNLDDVGITEEEAIYLLRNDIKRIKKELNKHKWFKRLSENRQNVIIDMAFNLGLAGLFKFEKMIKALENYNYELAAYEMENSKWCKQVKSRCDNLKNMMLNDVDVRGLNV
jgi:lysozyme